MVQCELHNTCVPKIVKKTSLVHTVAHIVRPTACALLPRLVLVFLAWTQSRAPCGRVEHKATMAAPWAARSRFG